MLAEERGVSGGKGSFIQQSVRTPLPATDERSSPDNGDLMHGFAPIWVSSHGHLRAFAQPYLSREVNDRETVKRATI
jgi:hypothetical protein